MSNAVSALDGATFQGFAKITDLGLRGMITLRGDLASSKIKKAVQSLTGLTMPRVLGRLEADDKSICWMSPDEVLILCGYSDAQRLAAALGTALDGTFHLVANVSDARALIEVSGVDAREVIGKLSPADLSPKAFAPGQLRRTRLAQVPVAFWMSDEDTVQVICFRSVARYVFDVLANAARPGTEVEFY